MTDVAWQYASPNDASYLSQAPLALEQISAPFKQN
jgi:hypothetical protein